ncbi:MAG: hypothetical protein E7436_01390 [Ruminococcaceae bacterium]|nr:hypothetical protein [Oscillospiraceae bacterium]
MNGEIRQASGIVISARKALFENSKINFTPSKHTLSIQFIFARKLLCKSVQASSVCEWFDICLQRGLKDVKFIIPTNRDHKHLLGFANTSQCAIVCYWKNGKLSCFCPYWAFDREQNKWKIIYDEQHIKNHTVFDHLHFTNKIDEFKETLLDIGKFAAEIEEPYYADVFHHAYEVLSNSTAAEDDYIPKQLPNEFKTIYYAADQADVFGAMGSWNDSPPYSAHKKGMDKEYNELSNKLLVQLRYNLMYVANECWKRN